MLLRNAHWILLAVCVFLVYIIYSASDEQPPRLDDPGAAGEAKRSPLIVNVKNRTRLKSILYWNEFYGRYDTFDFGFGNEPFHENGCQYTNCFATKVWFILYCGKHAGFDSLMNPADYPCLPKLSQILG